MAHSNLISASKAKNDEFYTRLTDIEKEMKFYKNSFKNKHIFCNCDDPEQSNFWRYFALNFKHLKINQLTTTHYNYDGSPSYRLDMYKNVPETEKNKETFLTLEGSNIDLPLGYITPMKCDGDFRSEESKDILKESDIVVTNPPFSLFREYIYQLISNNKKFIILGNKNALTYKEIFPLIANNHLWIGHRNMNRDFWLYVPKGKKFEKLDEDKKPVKHIMACWYTNIDVQKRHENLITYKKYNPKDYPKYDNCDAIEVTKVKDIPKEYYGKMGVPITFIDKYNPEQFKIVGFRKGDNGKDLSINGKYKYSRILIKRIKK